MSVHARSTFLSHHTNCCLSGTSDIQRCCNGIDPKLLYLENMETTERDNFVYGDPYHCELLHLASEVPKRIQEILVLPNTYIYTLFFYLGGRLYSISLVATLNARQGLRKQVNSMHVPSDPDPESVRVSRESQRSGQCLTDEIYVDMDYDSEMRPERLSAVSRLEDASTGFGQTVRHSKAADPDV
ncbi:hypothetical protein A0H81_07126 [Grifola frondosa]|uniref:DUF6534 domain-containing protein n=1 Tax=Grifola frondosa TaxID=5627 RepID=A0A1C7M820_GRIFR|nr:hypothetical protein A0H81_07126 [Grifola frondosa]